MFMSHFPFMEKLVSFVITDDETKRTLKFKNGGVVYLDMEDENWFIKWAQSGLLLTKPCEGRSYLLNNQYSSVMTHETLSLPRTITP